MEHDPISLAALRRLTSADCLSQANTILEGFATAKRMLEARFVQYASFLAQTPWNLVGLLGWALGTGYCLSFKVLSFDSGVCHEDCLLVMQS